jgi:hypothetical protein
VTQPSREELLVVATALKNAGLNCVDAQDQYPQELAYAAIAAIDDLYGVAQALPPADLPEHIRHAIVCFDYELVQTLLGYIAKLRAALPASSGEVREALEPSKVIAECQSVIEVYADVIRVQKTTLTPDGLSAVARALLPVVTARLEAKGIAALKSSPSAVVQPVGETACICDTDHLLFKERGHHPLCPASSTNRE